MDRRIERTRTQLFDALIAILAEKDFEKVSIVEIADRANVNRGTVYAHFSDKHKLLDVCVGNYVDDFTQECSAADPRELMLRTFLFIEEKSSVFRVLLSDHGTSTFRNALLESILMSLDHSRVRSGIAVEANWEIRNHFFASAVVGVIEWWIREDFPYSPEEMVENLTIMFRNE